MQLSENRFEESRPPMPEVATMETYHVFDIGPLMDYKNTWLLAVQCLAVYSHRV